MTDHIFDYISEVLQQYFNKASVSFGEKYHIRYEQEQQVQKQYDALRNTATNAGILVIPFEYNDYTSYSLQFKNFQLIIAANIDGVSADFLTGLRNRVADASHPAFLNSAILFIHNTSLDSIIGGCKSLSESGMPLNAKYVKDNIQRKINDDLNFESYQKHILVFRLNQIGKGNEDSYSLFDYAVFLDVLGKRIFDLEDYTKLGLFADSGLIGLNKEEIEKRLRKNEEWFNEISNGHQYGNLEKTLEKSFSQKGVNMLKAEDWFTHDFKDLFTSAAEKERAQDINYLVHTSFKTDDFLVFWDRAEGSTLAKSRIRHIIIFNYDRRSRVNFTLPFDGKPKKEGLGSKINLVEEEVLFREKNILLNYKLENPDKITLKSFSYEHPNFSAKHIFIFLIVPFKEELITEIKPSYLIKNKTRDWYIELSIENSITLNHGHSAELSNVITNGAIFTILDEQSLTLKLNTSSDDYEQEDTSFEVRYNEVILPIRVAQEIEKTQSISGQDVWYKKNLLKQSFKYDEWFDARRNKSVVTLIQGTAKYYPLDEFRENLRIEQIIRETGKLSYFEGIEGTITVNADIVIADEIMQAYQNIIAYFKNENLLPSLATLNDELRGLYQTYLSLYIEQLNKLEEGKALSKKELNLLKVGTLEMQIGEKLLKLTPLHPLNIAYQLELCTAIKGEEVASYLIEKLRPLNLVPFIKNKRKDNSGDHYFYQPIEQKHSVEWLYYFCDEVSSQQVSRYFVPKLVHEKIEQFLKHFYYLFLNKRATLKINLFNQGDGKEILEGIFLYYAKFFRKDQLNQEDAVPIKVTIYGSSNYMTKFEELTLYDDVKLIEEAFNFKFSEPEELFDLYSRKVTFFKMDGSSENEYAHLSFFQFSPAEVQKSSNIMQDVPSGISLGGLMADVPSVFQQNAFRSGFGTGGIDTKQNDLLQLAVSMNAYVNVTHSEDQFNSENAIAFVINQGVSEAIENVYVKSQWVTFIEPKVDLTFFKSYKDVVIIHYSDQYNNASGYDAITITSKWEPYKATIQEVFKEQEVIVSPDSIIHIIDIFNAINGHWLLMMNNPSKNNANFRMEKLSLLSAVKASLAIFYHEKITWVPVSMEEILRVSGAVGLEKAGGLFSVKNLGGEGVHSDDLLLIGLENSNSNLILHFYPIEVKIGIVESGTFSKAKEQGKNTVKLIREFLIENPGLSGKIYRNFFAKLVLINAKKCCLYDIWPSYNQRWKKIQDYQPLLLQDKFEVSNSMDTIIGSYGVIAFKWSSEFLSRSIQYEDDGCIITMLKRDGLDYLTKDLDNLNNELQSGTIDVIQPGKLLRNRYLADDEIFNDLEIEKDNLELNTHTLIVAPVVEVSETEALIFNKLTRADIELIYLAIYEKLSAINIDIKKELFAEINFIEGPAFYRIEIKPSPTTTIKKIKSAVDELKIALRLPEESNVRIFSDLGKIWLEAPKQDSQKILVTTSHIWPSFKKTTEFKVPFGTDIEGSVQNVNFSSSNSPHLLLAGTTGSGKSVVLDTLIRGAAHFYSPQELQMFLIDPKGNELIDFEELEHVPKPNGMSSDEAVELLQEGVTEMDKRYNLFREIRHKTGRAAKDIIEYNQMMETEFLPRWLIILDEYSDLLDENPGNKNTIELLLKRLAQKARAAGIHVIVATQKPLVNIISSAIKSNLPGVIALRVRTAVDSRVILDDSGAETLGGKGDSLFKNGTGQMVRVQCAIHQP